MQYFPNPEDSARPWNREWALTIFGTLRPDLAERLISYALDQRAK